MKSKVIVIATFVLSIVTVISGMILNFQEFLMGSPATLKNLIVTFAYIVIWILVLTISIKIKNRGILKYCSVFWIITLLTAILTMYINSTEVYAGWAIPIVILLLGQWYGINFFTGSFLNSAIVMAFISLAISATAIVSLKRIK